MNPWEILDIEQTEDISKIKRAYAKKIKVYNPEVDAEKFQLVREAYEYLVNNIKNRKAIENIRKSNAQDNETLDIKTHENSEIEIIEKITKLDLFLDEVNNLYSNFFDRINEKNWTKILNNEVVWDIENREAVAIRLLEFFKDKHFLPRNIWILLDENFNWSSMDTSLYKNATTIEYIIDHIKRKPEVSYEFFNNDIEVDYDLYIRCCEEASKYINNREYYLAQKKIDEALEIYSKDPEIYRIIANLFKRKKERKTEINNLSIVLDMIPNDFNALYLRGIAYFKLEDYNLALEDSLKVLEIEPENKNILNVVVNCYYKLEKYEEARKYLIVLYKIDYDNVNVLKLLVEVYSLRIEELKLIKRKDRDIKEELQMLSKEFAELEKKLEVKYYNMYPDVIEEKESKFSFYYIFVIIAVVRIIALFFKDN